MLPRDDAYENTYDEKHEMDETRGAGRRAQKMARIIWSRPARGDVDADARS